MQTTNYVFACVGAVLTPARNDSSFSQLGVAGLTLENLHRLVIVQSKGVQLVMAKTHIQYCGLVPGPLFADPWCGAMCNPHTKLKVHGVGAL